MFYILIFLFSIFTSVANAQFANDSVINPISGEIDKVSSTSSIQDAAGWASIDGYVYLDVPTDNVGIGTSTPGKSLTVYGTGIESYASAANINAIYHPISGIGGCDSNAIQLFHFEESVGTNKTVSDSNCSGSGVKTAYLGGGGGVVATPSKFDNAGSVYGGTNSSSYFNTSPFYYTLTGDTWTFEGWYYFESLSSSQSLAQAVDHGLWNWGYILANSPTNIVWRRYCVNSQCGGTNYDSYISATLSTPLQTGQWYHIAIVRNGSTGKVFVNGVSQTVSTVFNSSIPVIGNATYIGSILGAGDSQWYGAFRFDELRISNSARYGTDFTPTDVPFDSTPSNPKPEIQLSDRNLGVLWSMGSDGDDNNNFKIAPTDFTTSPILVLSQEGTLGVNDTTPTGKLSIKGDGTTTGINTQWKDSTGAAKVTILDNGNIGVGTTSPSKLMTVAGDVNIGASAAALYGTPNPDLFVDGNAEVDGSIYATGSTANYLAGNLGIGTSASTQKLLVKGNGTTTGVLAQLQDSTGAAKVTVLDNGNVGIGSTTPNALLSLGHPTYETDPYKMGMIIFNGWYNSAPTYMEMAVSASNPYIKSSGGNAFIFQNNAGIGFSNYARTDFFAYFRNNGGLGVGAYADYPLTNNIPTNGFIADGNVGIGTYTSTAKLTVQGAGTTTGVNTQWLNSTGAAKVTLLDNGNVGIGSTSPAAALDVSSGNVFINGVEAFLSIIGQRTDFVVDGTCWACMYHSDDDGAYWPFTSVGNLVLQSRDSADRGIAFVTGSAPSVKAMIASDGNFGIGTTVPSQKLHVDGNLYVSGTAQINQGYADELKVSGLTTEGPYLKINNTVGAVFDDQEMGKVQWYMNDANAGGITEIANIAAIINDQTVAGPIQATAGEGTDLVFRTGLVGVTGNPQTMSTRMTIDKNGNVGVGEQLPTGRLEVLGAGTTTGKAFTISDSASTEKVTVLDNGNVGIGTTSPSDKLSIASNCITLKSPDASWSQCCVDNSDNLTCTGL